MINSCQDMGVKYAGKNVTKHFGKSYLLNNSDELNILADVMENRIGLCYNTHMINCNCHQVGFNVLCKSTVNIAFLRIQPRRTKIQKIQQDTKNEGKRKETRRIQPKQWLVILNRLP